MAKTHKEIIQECERRLIESIVTKDLNSFHKLVHPEAVYTDEAGRIFTSANRADRMVSSLIEFEIMDVLEEHISNFNTVAIVNVLNHIEGKYLGMHFKGSYFYTRTWLFIDRKWQVIAAVALKV
ncbi:nuclear transport factor 2 family protein [Flavobacterium kingsejongi]|nr:nuclear transport factor 2 family protein [Flavobacterium kingsejongi]